MVIHVKLLQTKTSCLLYNSICYDKFYKHITSNKSKISFNNSNKQNQPIMNNLKYFHYLAPLNVGN